MVLSVVGFAGGAAVRALPSPDITWMNQDNSRTNSLWVEALSSVWRLLQPRNTDKGGETNELASARQINVYVKLVGTIKCCKTLFC